MSCTHIGRRKVTITWRLIDEGLELHMGKSGEMRVETYERVVLQLFSKLVNAGLEVEFSETPEVRRLRYSAGDATASVPTSTAPRAPNAERSCTRVTTRHRT